MSFSNLSRELRGLIYHALLCPPDGVRLHLKSEALMRKNEATKTFYETGESEEEEEDENEEVDDGKDVKICGNSNSSASAVTPVPTAIFYGSRQIGQEATEVFYSFNRFTFDTDAQTALKFLHCLRPSFRRRIKNIGFTRRSTCADDGDCTQFWNPLSNSIARHMSLHSVTVQVPRDPTHGIDHTKEVRQPPNSEWYWWPAARGLTGLLMAGNIQELRIGYSATLKIHAPEDEVRYEKAGQSPYENPLEDLGSISYLRYPRVAEELDREYSEYKDLRSALKEGRPHKFDSLGALYASQEMRRERCEFAVAREDDPVGDVGTVLVLTRPTAHQGHAPD
ncbi:hypothetical protein HO133_003848 [Letharia lupina]|uniref:Uncharacterized protein n=1 Tax=Letharia lupina TaxID=560253 RepID=A0A8H6F9U7_9LECA|nr:uncharacterized protein HO133_003848 [Letharia lupina]KAF6220023.1 hypothetical protein HO133_003848 [Letharia lupina]